MLTTAPCLANGLMTNAGMRCASTWSAPSCESSSTTKIAEDFQIDECEISWTIRPRPSSFSAIIARGVRAPALRTSVWSLDSTM